MDGASRLSVKAGHLSIRRVYKYILECSKINIAGYRATGVGYKVQLIKTTLQTEYTQTKQDTKQDTQRR
jgi:hypothetical protein